MDIALLKKMNVYPTDADLAGLIPDPESGESTLIKADISRFHDAPPSLDVSPQDELPTISQYDQGFEQGQETAARLYKETIKVMQAALDGLQSELTSMAREIEASHLSALAACLRAVFPALMRGGTDLELHTVLKDACGSALKGKIQLYLHPDDQAHCEDFCRGQDILIMADDKLSPQQMRLEWMGGGADIDCQSVATLCLERLNAALPVNSQDQSQEPSHA